MASNEQPATQDNRPAILATPLGKDVLLFSRMDCIEGMGELFEYRIEALSEIAPGGVKSAKIDFDKALGQNCSVHLNTIDSENSGRDFSGVLTEAVLVAQGERFNTYRLVLRPWLWLLCLTSDSRIFSNKTPIEIIKEVFTDPKFGSSNFDFDASQVLGDYPTLEYTVQYQETDLNFVLRLMEEYGIYYYFEFASGTGASPSDHKLVLDDLRRTRCSRS